MADERDPSEPVDRYEPAVGPNATRDDDMARAAHERVEEGAAPVVPVRRPATKRVARRTGGDKGRE